MTSLLDRPITAASDDGICRWHAAKLWQTRHIKYVRGSEGGAMLSSEFLPLHATAMERYCHRMTSVRPSVRPSVCDVGDS